MRHVAPDRAREETAMGELHAAATMARSEATQTVEIRLA